MDIFGGAPMKSGASQVALVVKNLPASAGVVRDTTSLIPGSGEPPGGGNGNSLQYSFLENSMNRGAWWAIVHGVTKSWTQPKQLSTMKSNFLFLCSPIVHTPHICTPLISSFGLQVLMASFPLKKSGFHQLCQRPKVL